MATGKCRLVMETTSTHSPLLCIFLSFPGKGRQVTLCQCILTPLQEDTACSSGHPELASDHQPGHWGWNQAPRTGVKQMLLSCYGGQCKSLAIRDDSLLHSSPNRITVGRSWPFGLANMTEQLFKPPRMPPP